MIEQSTSATESCPSPCKRHRNSVAFTDIEIIELPYTLGDNPCVSTGVPVSASWEAQKRTTFKLEFFERYRPKRRTKLQLHIPKEARKQLMLQAGFTPEEIFNASRAAAMIRKGRFDTLNQLRARLQAIMANEDPTKYGLPAASSSPSSPPRRRRQQQPQHLQLEQQHPLVQQPQPLYRGKPSPISPKRKRDHQMTGTPPRMAHYDHSTTKRLRSPIQTTTSSSPRVEHYRYHPCAPSPQYMPTPQRMMNRLHIRPLVPPRRMLSPPKLAYHSVPRPL